MNIDLYCGSKLLAQSFFTHEIQIKTHRLPVDLDSRPGQSKFNTHFYLSISLIVATQSKQIRSLHVARSTVRASVLSQTTISTSRVHSRNGVPAKINIFAEWSRPTVVIASGTYDFEGTHGTLVFFHIYLEYIPTDSSLIYR